MNVPAKPPPARPARPFRAASADDLPLYPIQSDVRLNNWFFRWEARRWLNSSMRLTADPDVGYAYLNLIFIAQDQTPIGTLPVEPGLLARLLMMTTEAFESLCRRVPSPLAHWTPCLTDRGEVRLHHPFVLETLLEQTVERERRAAASSADATRRRLDRLRQAMGRAGFDRSVIGNDRIVERLDAWLGQNVKGNRTVEAYERAFVQGARNGWFVPERASD